MLHLIHPKVMNLDNIYDKFVMNYYISYTYNIPYYTIFVKLNV